MQCFILSPCEPQGGLKALNDVTLLLKLKRAVNVSNVSQDSSTALFPQNPRYKPKPAGHKKKGTVFPPSPLLTKQKQSMNQPGLTPTKLY